MKQILLVLCAAFMIACNNNEPRISKQDIEAYEKELKEKINVAKVAIVQMKLDLQEMEDSLSQVYTEKIDDFENRLNTAEAEFDSFKNISKKEIWSSNKSRLDSVIGYLELEMDSTRTNINQLIKQYSTNN